MVQDAEVVRLGRSGDQGTVPAPLMIHGAYSCLVGYGLGVVDGFLLSRSPNGSKGSSSASPRHAKSVAAVEKWSEAEAGKPEASWTLKLQPWPDRYGAAAALTLNHSF